MVFFSFSCCREIDVGKRWDFSINYNDSRIFFVESLFPIFVEDLRDDRLLHSYENFYPLDRSNIPKIGGLLDFFPSLLHMFEYPKLLNFFVKCSLV
jgi:hypothetical protein